MASNSTWAIKPNKDNHKFVVGIDLGHGETSAAYADIGWDEERGMLQPVKDIDLPQDKTFVIPSAISIDNNGEVRIGTDAFDEHDTKVHVCFKKQPQNINGQAEQLMIKFMHAVYELIRERMGAILTDSNHLVYIATPSAWDKETQELYGQMAAKAGMPIAGVTWESRAAFIKAQSCADSGLPQYVDKGAIVFDMGSSTLDFTYISTDVLRDNKKPIDFGYDCGASQVERFMYGRLRDENDSVIEFEQRYPQTVDKLLFEMRKGKEEYYRKAEHKLRKTIDFYALANDEDLDIARCIYKEGELDEFLKEKGYVDAIREAMYDFRANHITGKPIHAAFFTGGASRMTFLKKLVKECWGVELIYQDQNPSLTISQGVAETARSDVRSGGAGNIKSEIKKLMSDVDVYSIFAEKPGNRIEEELQASIATPVCGFRDADEDYCLLDLENSISNNIDGDVENIGEWATECMTEAFSEATEQIRTEMNRKMANYTKSEIAIGKLSTGNIELPEIDMDFISSQIKDIAHEFEENASAWTGAITGAAIGAFAAFVFGGPIGWIAGIGTLLYNAFFNNKTEEEKKEEAKRKKLDSDERERVYNEFENKWGEICEKIHVSVEDALYDEDMKKKVNTQCNKVLRSYAEECLRQTRLMLD